MINSEVWYFRKLDFWPLQVQSLVRWVRFASQLTNLLQILIITQKHAHTQLPLWFISRENYEQYKNVNYHSAPAPRLKC